MRAIICRAIPTSSPVALCISWGIPQNRPVLMVHGYMDSAATFIPIVKHLPDDYFYLAVDLPGYGKSDPFPVGVLISQVHQVEAVRYIVEHFKWDTFVYFAHSVGFAIGVLYNFFYPFKILKSVNLDPVPPLSTYCFHEYNPMLWYMYHYDDYYDNYARWELHRNKQYTYDQAIELLVRSRKLTKEQSAVVLSRTLIPLSNGMYKLSWEPSMKKVVGALVTEDMLCTIVTTKAPPMLNIVASIDETIKPLKENGIRLMKRFSESIPNFLVHNVDGTHDVHIINPESFVDKIIEFLNTDFSSSVKAKL
ncbi:serine hydrolase-like protein isoform X2 [Maniola jurtina]|uniref:serine hydrolase-like protein isoform X2 n=1 Tax=Maniola jurtina TaxID=191418 RepID=UPI001E68F629|nr:serine hydrolase-like protein isoform X2 [Maniola jurtina]